jgi:hypothetical protein
MECGGDWSTSPPSRAPRRAASVQA